MDTTTNTTNSDGFLGHPKGLMTLFFSEMWERFCFYGMRALLMLYLVKSLMKGDAEAALIYGAYTGLVYAAPILGGRMADQFLGYRYAVVLGAILMAIGEFLILGGTDQALLLGMGAIIIGNGYFKANISTIVGKLYKDNDERRDSGFTIFYIGINVGAFLATTVVAGIGETYGFHYGFGLAGIGMLLGGLIFYSGQKHYANAPGVNIPEAGRKKVFGPLNMLHLITIGSLALIPLCYALILNNEYLNAIFLVLFAYVGITLLRSGLKEDKEQGVNIWRDRMIALIIFMVINVVFWACFEQAGTSLTLFADRNVDRVIFGWEMPASMTQFFNPFFIIVFGSLFSMMWIKLSKIGKNPSIPMKFSLGILQLGLGFLLTYVGLQVADENLVPLVIMIFLYMLHTTGELFLSPIGLSMVTKLSPKRMAGTAMGAWFLSWAMANLLAGQIAALTGEEGGGEDATTKKLAATTTVEEAAIEIGDEGMFEKWNDFYQVPESMDVGAKDRNGVEFSKNINYAKYCDIQDWVAMREAVSDSLTLSQWMATRPSDTTITSAEQWLNTDQWDDLKSRYKTIIESDLEAKSPGMSLDDWTYYKGDIEELEEDFGDKKLTQAIKENVRLTTKHSLDKYVNLYTIIGLVLIAISLIVALFSKPLRKLMHGVE